jgi:hypothetical protein
MAIILIRFRSVAALLLLPALALAQSAALPMGTSYISAKNNDRQLSAGSRR